jgi:hypothetical protein
MERLHCHLEHAAGRDKPCPGDTCPFWTDDRCVIAPLKADLGHNPELVELLLGLRGTLAGHDPRSVFRLIHPPGLA